MAATMSVTWLIASDTLICYMPHIDTKAVKSGDDSATLPPTLITISQYTLLPLVDGISHMSVRHELFTLLLRRRYELLALRALRRSLAIAELPLLR